MTLKKTIWTAALCTGFIGVLFVSSLSTFDLTEAAGSAVEIQEVTPMDKGPHVLPPF